MNDLISRQAAIDAFNLQADDDGWWCGTAEDMEKLLKGLPSAEPNTTGNINRQAAIDRINEQRKHLQPDVYPQDKIGDAAYRICSELIERLPSAQPKQKKGKWIEEIGMLMCSECGDAWGTEQFDEVTSFNFCPNCGAKMEDENE